MLHRTRRRASYANVVATLALFIALGGVSYAAVALPAGSVGTRQLKNHAVTLAKINTRARAALTGRTGRPGAQGAPGGQGPPGTAVAYGRVASDGTLSDSAGNVTVAKGIAGYYCISVASVDPATVRMSVTLDYSATNNAAPPVQTLGGPSTFSHCPSGTFMIATGALTVNGGSIDWTATDEPFFFEIP